MSDGAKDLNNSSVPKGPAAELSSSAPPPDSYAPHPERLLPLSSNVPCVELPGATIGRYKLLEQIGEGGFGVVFMAEQEYPIRRRLALKVIKPGMDSKQVVARFEAERQALAMMDHPGIAKVLDAGATPAGRPYFVMELVKGVPLTDYCDRNNLSTRERLELFVQVCSAVQHAHQKGIIHRDIKPGNVLVTVHDGRAEPKVIDFGVAKALNQRLTEKTLFTEHRQLVGTPEYMSPEQAEMSGTDVDTRSDIYSLGVLLYELLTGVSPVDAKELRSKAFAEMQRIIREVEPLTPSTRLSTMGAGATAAAASRRSDPRKLGRLLRGDLDWIVMRCLEKDRARRYETAAALAGDVRRHLGGDAVDAGPPAAIYRLRKFARRHKMALSTTAVLSLMLIAATTVSTSMALRANRAERMARAEAERAKTETDIAEAVSKFLREDLLAQADPENQPDRDVTLRSVLDRAAQRIEGRFPRQPQVEAALRRTLGTTYAALGEYSEAERHLLRAVELNRAQGEQQQSNRPSMLELAHVYNETARHMEAEKIYFEALEAAQREHGDEHFETIGSMHCLARNYRQQGRLEEAERLQLRALELSARVLGKDHRFTAVLSEGLGINYNLQHRHAEAEKLLRSAVDLQRNTLGEEHRGTLSSTHFLADACAGQGKDSEAETLYIRALLGRRRLLGERHPQTLQTSHRLLWSHGLRPLPAINDGDRSVEAGAGLMAIASRHVELAPQDSTAWQVLGWAQYRNGDWQAAVESLEKSCALQGDGDEFQWFFLAMAHWHLAREDLARGWYTASCQLQDRNDPERKNPDGRRIRSEAAATLGLPELWPPTHWAPAEADLQVYDRLLKLSPKAEWPLQARAAAEVRLAESQEPFGLFAAAPAAVPGVIQAEDFDRGGITLAYFDTSMPNTGTEPDYRTTMVDIDACQDVGGGCNVGGIIPGEWLAYTIEVKDDGVYDLHLRLSSPGGGGTLHLEFDGEDRTGSVVIPKTGDWNKWQTVTTSGVRLSKGRQVMRVVFDTPETRGGQRSDGDGHVCNVNWLRIDESSSGTDSSDRRAAVQQGGN